MQCCRCLNKNAHPEDAEDCDERCGFCLGYCSPVSVAVIIIGLVISNLVYFALLISRNKTSAWRIVLSIIFILIPLFCGGCVLWSYYVIIFTPPGYVPKDPWALRPTYVGDGPGPTPSTPTPTQSEIQSRIDIQQQQRAARREQAERGSQGSYPTEETAPARTFLDKEAGAVEGLQVEEAPPKSATAAVLVSGSSTATRLRGERSHSPFDAAGNVNPIADLGTSAAAESSPASQQHATRAQENPYTVKNLDHSKQFRYCKTCNLYKPDLAHHCSVCNKCIYNFDHHCPYVNNCVGRNNYKLFLVFVLYGCLGCWLSLICCVIGIFVIDRDSVMTKVGWVAIPAVELILGLALMCFYIQHSCMMCDGETTLENIIKNSNLSKNGWNYWKKPKLSDEEKAAQKVAKQAKVKAHHDTLMGDEHPWYRRYLPYPVRTDVTADDTLKQA